MPKGFYALIAAQFASGLADNALLILGIFILSEQGHAAWWAPFLKFSLNLSYVLLASVVGPLSDAFPKGQVMAWMNSLKIAGLLLMLIGLHPVLAFAVIGLAAAIYAPAKYGLVTESVPPQLLVRANAWLEVSVVLSVVLGIALGGALVGWSQSGVEGAPVQAWLSNVFMRTRAWNACAVVGGIYLVASLLNARLKHLSAGQVMVPLRFKALRWRHFWQDNFTLWTDRLGGVSLYVTTLYWGVGAVMQFAVLAWAQESLGLPLQQGAYLQALVAIGVIFGAWLAGRYFKLHSAKQALPWGLSLAVLLPIVAMTTHIALAIPLLLCAGAAGGMLLVPMNALLQHRGRQVLSPGRSIAVQGFNENLSVLVLLSAYSLLVAYQVSLLTIMSSLALLLLVGMWPMCRIVWRRRRDFNA
jgi:LPLT family lysophospholipid transporter-like MFS transporter